MQGHARRDGRHGLPRRVCQEERQARDEALRRRADARRPKTAKRRARKACKAEGKRGRALKRCVRGKLAAEPPSAAPEAFKEAVEECKAAREEDPEGFAEEYGEGR